MRHRVSRKHLGRTTSHRKALRRNMGASLIQHGTIRTTEAKAKELRRFVEKLITIAKKGTLHARRQVIAAIGDRNMLDDEAEPVDKTVVQKLFDEIAPRYADRNGGYTRIIRLADRRIGDSGRQVLVQLVEESPTGGDQTTETTSRRRRRAAKRLEAAGATDVTEDQVEETEEETEEATEEEADQEQADDTDAEGEETGPEDKQDAEDKQDREETGE